MASEITLPDRYRLLGHIASGGMAAVYAAEDRVLERRVAVKVLATHLASEPGAQERFAREARAAARVSDHPHVVTIYDVGEHGGRAFMVMEHMAGGTLADRLRDGRPARQDAVRWLDEAASALDTAHRAEIVHRDVKPANLLLDGRNRLAVGDFGIARLAADTAMTQTGMVLGSAAYISPEQAMGHQATRASDRYALAVVAYELLTGERPFRSGTAASQARQHIDESPPRASHEAPDLPAALDEVLARGMAKAPEDRPASAQELADAIRGALEDGPTASTAPTGAAAPDRRASPSRRFPVFIAALLAVGIAAALAVAALSGGEEEPTTTQDGESAQTESAEEPQAQQPEPAPEPEPRDPDLSGADPVALNNEGYDLFVAGRYAEAVPVLQRSVGAFESQGRTGEVDYAYALYNLGASLNRSGRPQEAIPILQRRLEVAPENQPEAVRAELAAARGEQGDGRGQSRGRGNKNKKNED
ncbi:MAG TPA: serine/threonine-protein kinase [Solirubrobacteraceae bacterium]|nr:serine/threonine-protein kinase [Solirubrobacteraceae bacterium]